jgi:hypothetical protein
MASYINYEATISNMNDILKRIERIELRNKRVEADKSWETSWARRLLITFLTYTVIVVFFHVANLSNPWINSIIPALAFILSTLTIGYGKSLYLKQHKS